MELKPVKVGVIGCGAISQVYFQTLKRFNVVQTTACADLIMDRAEAKAKEYGIAKACTVAELLADPEIEIILNLTIPKAHFEVAMKIIESGKSVYNEKPLGLNRDEGRQMLELAQKKKVLVGCAPDTFMGGALQTCRKLIDDGWIGEPVAVAAHMIGHGHESWHPDPDFYYQPGAGPLFDMGPYYLTALTMLIGPVRQVTGLARRTFEERIITSQPHYGEIIKVNTPTHIEGLMEFANGAIGRLTMSFDVWEPCGEQITIFGTQGTLSVPDPNCFGGTVRIRPADASEWSQIPLTHGYASENRGIGVVDMAYALRTGKPHRATGENALHVLDIMQSILESAEHKRHVAVESMYKRTEAMPLGPAITQTSASQSL